MLIYSAIMFLAAALLLTFSIAIYRGRTDLIHFYHQTKVTDKAAYGKAFGKALLVVAAAPGLSRGIGDRFRRRDRISCRGSGQIQ